MHHRNRVSFVDVDVYREGVMPSCAFADCGDPECPVCKWGRAPYRQDGASASTQEPMRDDAPADLKAKKTLSPAMPRRRHRVGPHR